MTIHFINFLIFFFLYIISLLQKQIDNGFNECIDLNLQEKNYKKKKRKRKKNLIKYLFNKKNVYSLFSP